MADDAVLPDAPADLAQLNATLDDLSRRVLPAGLRLQVVDVDQLVEQEVNARSMSQPMFEQFVANVRKTQGLESVPLCVRTARGVEIISGHHRTRAARAAGLTRILALVYDSLTPSAIVAKQLAHNTISGSDDLQLVKRLFEQIADVDAKLEAFVDPKTLTTEPEPLDVPTLSLDLADAVKSVLVVFLPSQLAPLEQFLATVAPTLDADRIYLAHRDTFDAWTAALKKIKADAAIVPIPTAIAEMARLATDAHGLQLAQKGDWVPLASLFPESGGAVPPDVARLIADAVAALKASGDLDGSEDWRALEFMAAEILNR